MPEKRHRLGNYIVDFSTGDVFDLSDNSPNEAVPLCRLEPKASSVLLHLYRHAGQIVSKEALIQAVWPDTVISDDALLRCISRLRKDLSDDAKQPHYIETVPKRGYRLICEVQFAETEPPPADSEKFAFSVASVITPATLIVLAMVVAITIVMLLNWPKQTTATNAYKQAVSRADNYYHQMRLSDNEMAITLYEQGMALRPQSADAQAGLANALVQKILRWSGQEGIPAHQTLGEAIQAGIFESQKAQPVIERALALAQQAVKLNDNSVRAHKALGFVLSAKGRFDEAQAQYQRALELDADAWQVLINLGEISDIRGQTDSALQYYQRAFDAMTTKYEQDITQIRPWYAKVGVLVGKRYKQANQPQTAEIWYRRVLAFAPLDVDATLGLATLLAQSGDKVQAIQLCTSLNSRVGTHFSCKY